MYRLVIVLYIGIFFTACNAYKTQLVGVKGSNESDVFIDDGMVYIPSGSFLMGVAEDKFHLNDAPPKRVSLDPFYIDKSEITFREYRQFVFWVRDSLLLDEEAAKDEANYIYENPQTHEKTPIYPNIKVWKLNYPGSKINISEYFKKENPVLDNYPVVGVSWEQANAFAAWRTDIKGTGAVYSLPTEAQWEYAARGGIDNLKYPWVGYGTKNSAGFYLANFYAMKGRQVDDGSTYIALVQEYSPNGFGLYDMAGNVAEWVYDNYHPRSYEFSNNHNPVFIDSTSTTKVTRGGSWQDISYFLQNGARDWADMNQTYANIGFRCVASFTGSTPSPHAPDPDADIPLSLKLKETFKKDKNRKNGGEENAENESEDNE